MPVFDVCKAEPRRDHKRQTSLTSSFDVASTTTGTTTSTSSSSLRPISSFEVLFSRLLDVLIFTSAIAITAYSYLTGTLFNSSFVETSASTTTATTTTTTTSTPTASTPTHHHKIQYKTPYKYEEPDLIKRRRIQEWTQEQKLSYTKKRHSSTSLLENKKVQLPRNMKRDKKRTQSLSSLSIDHQPEEILLSRMEERLQSLIQQGQEALLSPVKYNK